MRHTQRMNLFWGQTLPASTATWLRTLKNLDLNIAMIWKSLTSGGWVQDPRLWDWETWFSTTFLGAFLFGNPKTKLRHLQQIWGPWVWVDINLYPLVSSSFWSSPNSLWFLNAAGDVGISRIQNSPWSKEPHAKILLGGSCFRQVSIILQAGSSESVITRVAHQSGQKTLPFWINRCPPKMASWLSLDISCMYELYRVQSNLLNYPVCPCVVKGSVKHLLRVECCKAPILWTAHRLDIPDTLQEITPVTMIE